MQATGKCSLSKAIFGLVDPLGGGVGVGEREFLHGVLLHHVRAAECRRRRGSVGDGSALEFAVAGDIEGLAELPAGFAFDTVIDGVEDSVDNLVWCVLGLGARLVDTSAD